LNQPLAVLGVITRHKQREYPDLKYELKKAWGECWFQVWHERIKVPGDNTWHGVSLA
jgi:hypothetical protein